MGRLIAARYDLEEVIGRGNMGAVWRATDQVLHRVVAVKFLELSDAAGAQAAEHFRTEARTAARLVHANIATVYDYGVDDGVAYIVMELLDGPTLDGLLRRSGPMPLLEALAVADQVAAALAAAHAVGVVHADLTPRNVCFASPDVVKVLAFGVPRIVEATTGVVLAHGSEPALAAAGYLAPEQTLGRPPDARSDLYALGCLITAMVAGRPPFVGDDPVAVGHAHVHADPPLVSALRPEVPAALDELVASLLAKAPERRPSQAREVRAELAAITRSLSALPSAASTRVSEETLPLAAIGPDVLAPDLVGTSVVRPVSGPPPAGRRAGFRNARRLVPLAALVVGLGIVGGVLSLVVGHGGHHAAAALAGTRTSVVKSNAAFAALPSTTAEKAAAAVVATTTTTTTTTTVPPTTSTSPKRHRSRPRPAPTTLPPATVPATTVPTTTVPPTTLAPTSVPATTAPPTTVAATVPPTTAATSTVPPTTAATSTVPPTTAAATTPTPTSAPPAAAPATTPAALDNSGAPPAS